MQRTTIILALVTAAVLAGCGPATLPTVSVGPPPSAIDASAWAAAVCQSVDQLEQAIGDPGTGQRSAAWNAFETALAGGDEDELKAAANGVLGHLTEGSRTAAGAAGFPAGAAAVSELRTLHDELADGVRSLRDATLVGDAGTANEARRSIDAAIEARYEQALGQLGQVPLGGAGLPCA